MTERLTADTLAVMLSSRAARGAIAGASVAALAVAGAGCGEGSSVIRQPRVKVSLAAQFQGCTPGATFPLRTRRVAYAAIVRDRARVFRRPGRGPFASFSRLNVNGFPTVFGILAATVGSRCEPLWYHVQLPLRPNGVTGYVRAGDVDVNRIRTRIVVDLSARRLTLLRNGRAAITTVVAVGSPATPTPTGRFYVNQRLLTTETYGPYGPGALGISAFSPVLTGWAQGGPVAIHGTNEPWSIGHAVSNGCIRVPNAVLRRLFARTLAGTPVVVHA